MLESTGSTFMLRIRSPQDTQLVTALCLPMQLMTIGVWTCMTRHPRIHPCLIEASKVIIHAHPTTSQKSTSSRYNHRHLFGKLCSAAPFIGLANSTVRCSENGCSVRCSVQCSILNMFGILFGSCSCSAFGGCCVRVHVRTACSCSARCSGLIHMLMLNVNAECQC